MKKIFGLCGILFALLSLVSCRLFSSKEKEFTKAGITITLTDRFVESENINAQLYLISNNIMVAGNRETKTQITLYFGELKVEEYAKRVLKNAGQTGTIELYEDEEITFAHTSYTATVDTQDFSYLLVCLKSENYYYTINFACFTSKFESYKDTFMSYAKTIRVE